MIEKHINNLKNKLENIRMSADDKRDVFERISLVVDKIEAISSESHKAPVLSPFPHGVVFGKGVFNGRFASSLFVYVKQRKFVPSLVIVLLLFVTGGFSAAAEGALPGDSLYSLKVNVNEQVKGFVAVTPEAKARLAVETTERRLQEAVILSSQGKLTNEKKQILQGQLSKNATEVKNSVATLVASNNISVAQEVTTNFEASLKTHELILETLEKNALDAQNASTTTANASTTDANATTTSTTTNNTTGAVTNASTSLDVASSSTTINSTSTTQTPNTVVAPALQPVTTLLQDIRQEINLNTQVRESLSQKEIAQDSDPVKITSKIKDAKLKYSDLIYQRKSLTDLSPASIKLFNNYLGTASSTIIEAETALKNNDLTKAITSLQQSVKAMSDSDSLISIELNSKPEVRKALELIDINKLLNSIHSDALNSNFNSTSTTSLNLTGTNSILVNGTSTNSGAVLGTSTILQNL